VWYSILIIVLTGYLLGNLNGAVCISVLVSNDDVRTFGSGNAGLTNFIRNVGGWPTALVILVDVAKTALACLCGGLILQPYGLAQEGSMLGAVAVSLGHDFPALLGLKGGKGILCGLTIAIVIDWRIALLLFVLFAAVYFPTKLVSLASVLCALGFSICFAVLHHDNILVMVGGIALGLLSVYMHRANIGRLLKGNEKKTDLFKSKKK